MAESNILTLEEDEIKVIEVDAAEIIDLELEEVLGLVDETNDTLNHALLYNRDIQDQHPITAITGLRKELDDINALKTIYSDKKQQADYYLWHDENPLAENREGLFVSMHKAEEHNEFHSTLCCIEVCDGSQDVFGVTVAEAAFIGGQAYIEKEKVYESGVEHTRKEMIGNGYKYGLVVNSGIVGVRCETTVVVGDYVVPNIRGEAKKSDGDYGYLVTSLSEVNGIQYAIISLAAPSTLARNLSDSVQDLSGRMTTTEYNIASVTNVANSAYALAKDAKENADINAEYIEEKIEEVLGRMDEADGIIGNLSESVNNACESAALAKTIAEGAVSSAEAIGDDAVKKANEALTETTNTKKEVESKINEINTELDNTKLELQATRESFDSTIDDLKLDTEGQLADFKKEVSDNYATTAQLAAVKTETSDAIAAVKQEASDTYATQEMLTAYETETSEAIAGFKQEVTDTYATQEMLTTYKNDASDALASYKTEVAENYATQEVVSTLETNTTKALTDYKQEVTDTYATQEMVSSYKNEASEALAGYKQEVSENYATQEMLTNLETDTTQALADYKQEASDTYATQEMLTSFEGETNTSMANLRQQADENGAKIEALVANIDKYSVGEYSQAYGLSLEQAKNILDVNTVYVPTIVHSETYDAYTQEFSLGYYYTWDGEKWVPSQSTAVSFSSVYFSGTESTPYWVVTISDVINNGVTYDLGGLYHWEQVDDENYAWVKVASASDNVLSRAVSAIKVTANSIETSVTAIDNKYAGTKIWVDDNKSAIQDTVTWKSDNAESITTFMQEAGDNFASASQVAKIVDKDGNVNAASIVTAVNESGSSVAINADKIVMTGTTTFIKPGDLGESGNTIIDGARIKTGKIEAERLDLSGVLTISSKKDLVSSVEILYARSSSATNFNGTTEWSTTAPEWKEGEYMWQKTITTYADGHTSESDSICIQGADGEDGYTPVKGVDYFDGTDGSDGTSIIWRGTYTSAPSNPENGWAYYNSTNKASYVYQDGWYQMSIDGVNGQNGTDGSSIVWKGEQSSAPTNPEINWVYKDTEDGKVYIYNGTGWELMVLDGADGTDGEDGLSVFITYNNSTQTPDTPTGNGTLNGWSTAATSSAVWMSQKVAKDANSGSWGSPIKIKGENGIDGVTPTIGSNGNWFLGNTDTGIKAEGVDGYTPTVEINSNGYWVINGITTTVKAIGVKGNDGIYVETIIEQYYLSTSVADVTGGTWTDIVDNTTLPIEKGKYRFRRQKYIWSDHTEENPHITHSAQRLDETDQRIIEWCKEGSTLINGGSIYANSITSAQLATDAIKSIEYDSGNTSSLTPSDYATKGTFLDLQNGGIYTQNFVVKADGSAHLKGNLDVGGKIGAFDIDDYGIIYKNGEHSVAISGSSVYPYAFFAGGETQDTSSFYVTKQGGLYAAAYAKFGTWRTPYDIYFQNSSGGIWNGLEGIDDVHNKAVVFTAQGVGIRDISASEANNEFWSSSGRDENKITYENWCTWSDIIKAASASWQIGGTDDAVKGNLEGNWQCNGFTIPKILMGSYQFTGTADAQTKSVTFSPNFSSTPKILVSLETDIEIDSSGQRLYPSVVSPSKTGFTLKLFHTAADKSGMTPVTVNWVAIGY